MQRSNVTLQPFPSIKEVVTDLLEGYLSEQGYGDFYDLAKVLYSTKHEDIVKELICQAEEINEREMLKSGLCPECGSTLEWREIKANRTDPGESWLECQTCIIDYERRVG